MVERLDLWWRTVATVLCFSLFGLGGLLLRLAVLPLMRLAVHRPERRSMLAKAVVHRAFALFVAMMRWLGVISCEVHGQEKLQRAGLLILANHPTLLDVVLLMSLIERADCVVKSSLARNAFTGGPIRAAGFVFSDSGSRLIDDCIASVRSGNNLIIFPQGTRTPPDGDIRLHRGAATVSVRGGFDITPVRIRCRPPALGKGHKWFRVPAQRPRFDIEIGDDMKVAGFTTDSRGEAHAARRLNNHLTDYFSRESERVSA